MRKPQSSGRTGELVVEYWFKNHNWVMFRTQPGTRVCKIGGVLKTIQAESHGEPDYTGYKMVPHIDRNIPHYIACEVKESPGDKMRASRLSEKQRIFMSMLPSDCAMVAIYWLDIGQAKIYPFKMHGSYKRDEGVK